MHHGGGGGPKIFLFVSVEKSTSTKVFWACDAGAPQRGGGGGVMWRGRGRRDNELIGQTVRISQGPYKG